MKHYTFSLLTLLVTAIFLQGCLNAQSPSYAIYDNCNEYYDSRGFYHKDCPDNKFDKRKMRKTLRNIKAEIDPGTGEDQNSTNTSKLGATIDDIIDDTSPDDPTIKGQGNDAVSTPAIPERPELEFGRETN